MENEGYKENEGVEDYDFEVDCGDEGQEDPGDYDLTEYREMYDNYDDWSDATD